jgi:transposase
MLQRYSTLQVVTEAQKVLELLKQLRDQLNQLLTTLSNLRKSFESLREGQT